MGLALRNRVIIAVTLLLLFLVLAATSVAQDFEGRRSGDQSGLGLGVMFAQPLGEFRYYVDESLGLNAFLHFDVGDNGALGLRLDGSMVYYGSQTRSQSLASGPGYIDYEEVTIRNRIGSFFIGPQMTFGSGDVRPYLHVGAGFSYFWTGSDWDDSYDDYCEEWEDHEDCGYGFFDVMGDLDMFFEGDTEHSQWTGAWTAGGGVSVRLAGSLNLYLALQYVNNGRVAYLPQGAIFDHGDGYYSFTPVESDANLLFAQFGIAIQ
jgi:opacity protein-like surface antigen